MTAPASLRRSLWALALQLSACLGRNLAAAWQEGLVGPLHLRLARSCRWTARQQAAAARQARAARQQAPWLRRLGCHLSQPCCHAVPAVPSSPVSGEQITGLLFLGTNAQLQPDPVPCMQVQGCPRVFEWKACQLVSGGCLPGGPRVRAVLPAIQASTPSAPGVVLRPAGHSQTGSHMNAGERGQSGATCTSPEGTRHASAAPSCTAAAGLPPREHIQQLAQAHGQPCRSCHELWASSVRVLVPCTRLPSTTVQVSLAV